MCDLSSRGAEREILGGILTDAGALHKVSRIIRAGDFCAQEYRLIYELMSGMILRGERPDLVTLTEAARARNKDAVKILQTVTDLGTVGKCYDIEKKAAIVADYARRRRLIDKGRELIEAAKDCGRDIGNVASTFCEDVQGITSAAEKDTGSMSDAVMELMATVERRNTGDAVTTGLSDLDRLITGFEPGQLITIAGRPGHGKSALAGTIAVNLARRGKGVLLFSLEMTKGELAGRFVSRLARIPGNVLKNPKCMTPEQGKAFAAGLDAVGKLPITITTQGNLTPGDVASIGASVKREKGLDLIIVDYIQLMTSGRRQENNRVQEISYITRSLKNLACSLDVPIVILSQLNRNNEKGERPPRITDLRDSGSIEQDSNTIILLHRETSEGGTMSAVTTANVAKQRDGETGECTIFFASAYGYFGDYKGIPGKPVSRKESVMIDDIFS